MNEWRDVIGYEGLYEVSSSGDIRNRHGRRLTWKRNIKHFKIELYRNGVGVFFGVHTLVLNAFVGPRPEGCEACHNNGNPRDNRVENLRWDSKRANAMDKVRHGTMRNRINGHYRAKLTVEDIDKIRYDSRTSKLVAAEYGVCSSLIRNIRCGIAR